jgi:hypothetical protein
VVVNVVVVDVAGVATRDVDVVVATFHSHRAQVSSPKALGLLVLPLRLRLVLQPERFLELHPRPCREGAFGIIKPVDFAAVHSHDTRHAQVLSFKDRKILQKVMLPQKVSECVVDWSRLDRNGLNQTLWRRGRKLGSHPPRGILSWQALDWPPQHAAPTTALHGAR